MSFFFFVSVFFLFVLVWPGPCLFLVVYPWSACDSICCYSVLLRAVAAFVKHPFSYWVSVGRVSGEYSSHVPKIAPDVLRQLAKTFGQEEDIVKLQILSMAAKLYLTNTKQTKLLTQYVLNLAKYDQNYDIRDRARFIRAVLLTKDTKLHKHSRDIFLSEKPAPNLVSTFEGWCLLSPRS